MCTIDLCALGESTVHSGYRQIAYFGAGLFLRMRVYRPSSGNSLSMELGTALASIVSGFVVKIGEDGIVHNFNYVGYISVAVGLLCIFLAAKIKIVSVE